jgi:signal transduction histidine kinase
MTGQVRLTVIVCVALICGSFAAAALIQMRIDHSHALSQSAAFTRQRAEELATDAGAALDRYQTIAVAFTSAETNAETSAALSEAGGAALKNVAVLRLDGALISEMRGAPKDLLPLSAKMLAEARVGRTILPQRHGSTIMLLFPVGDRLVAAEIDPRLILPAAGMAHALLALPSGRLLALGARWNETPAASALSLEGLASATRMLDFADGARLVSLERVPHWPLVAGASVRVEEALGAWYGSLPLYLFFILGPAFAGAALAVLFVRVFERHAKAAAAVRALRATRPDEARLLIRLAEAERRAADAERARDRFVAQVGHELRTPLNAIIGFAEVIERGVFGEPGHQKYVEYAHDIGHAGRELHAKIGSVLEYAALNALRQPEQASRTIVDAAEITRASLKQRAAVAHARGLKLVVSLPETARVNADSAALARILGHLLDNALAYTPSGGTVRVELRSNARESIIGIRDTGAGFSPRERAEAGRPFLRFPRQGVPAGMGVGLAIAMGLARRIGATLALSSPPGGGTLAELRLATAPEI